MKFPLSMTAGLAGYILKNKMRPRPEWQKTVAPPADAASLSVQHGIEYLLESQREDGSWEEELATGTGFPKVFYLNYHLYKDYFPLLALATFVKARANSNG